MEISTKTLHFIEEHREDDTRTLALQSKKYPDVDMAAAVTQIAGRQVAARKIPSWYPVSALWYPPHLSMEQCSSEATALYKASLLEGDTFADLTGGFGIDCSFISRNFKQADYVKSRRPNYKPEDGVKLHWEQLLNKKGEPLKGPATVLQRFKELSKYGWTVDKEAFVKRHYPSKKK
jgi:hypothetical protein